MRDYKSIEDSGGDGYKAIQNDYYLSADVNYWLYKIDKCLKDYQTYKSAKYKSKAIVDCYSIYIQLIEIFFINLHTTGFGKKSFLPALFISNQNLKSKIIDIKENNNVELAQFLEKYIKPIQLHFSSGNTTVANDQMRMFRNLFDEVIKDYLKDYEFLNAFKHGFRVNFESSDRSYSIGITGKQQYQLLSTKANIKYYSKAKSSDGRILIYDNEISFHPDRIFGKCYFVFSMLHNMFEVRKCIANPARKQSYRNFEIYDKQKWNQSYDSFRHKMEIVEIQNI